MKSGVSAAREDRRPFSSSFAASLLLLFLGALWINLAAPGPRQTGCAIAQTTGGQGIHGWEAVFGRGSHPFLLSQDDLRRGLAFHGTGARARAAAAKLLAGRPVHVAIVGASVAWGQGAPGGGSFGQQFFDWLTSEWPAAEGEHRLTNAAKPGITSALFALCARQMIPQDADIVVLEFAFNDYHPELNITGPERLAYERLVRSVLSMPSAPAVFSMHFFSYWQAKPKLKGPQPPPFFGTGEDDLAVIAQYYDLPVLSLRNAVLHRMRNNDPGFRVDVLSPRDTPGADQADYFYWDDRHPWEHTGHRAMAELLIAAMQAAVVDGAEHGEMALRGPEAAGRPTHEQHQQQQQGARRRLLLGAAADSRGQENARRSAQQGAQQAAGEAWQLARLPKPMFAGNYESEGAECKLGAAFREAVVQADGFEWRPQAPQGRDASSQKWAWLATSPGATALLRLDTRLRQAGGDGGRQREGPARVYLGHTRSWRQLGTARVECVSGCSCEAAVMDNHWRYRSTQAAMLKLEVTQHERCEIRVTVDQPASADVSPLTALTAAMVDGVGAADIDRKGNVGQWDLMQ